MLPNGQPPSRLAPMQTQIPPVNGMHHQPYTQGPPLQQQHQFLAQGPPSVPKHNEPPRAMNSPMQQPPSLSNQNGSGSPHFAMHKHAPTPPGPLGPGFVQPPYPVMPMQKPQGPPRGPISTGNTPTRGSPLPAGIKNDAVGQFAYSTPGSSSAFKPFPPQQSMPQHPILRPVLTSQQGPSVPQSHGPPLLQDPNVPFAPSNFSPSLTQGAPPQGPPNFPPSMPRGPPGFLPPVPQPPPVMPSQQQQAGVMPGVPLPHQNQTSNMNKRYPSQAHYGQPQPASNNINEALASQMGSLSVTQTGFSKLWGMDTYDLMQIRNILPPEKIQPPKISLHQSLMESANCSHDIFRCTLTKIPESSSLLQKSRLPLGILIHPFKDLSQLPVIQCNTIVRCRACRTYINPFVYFVDHRRWKCNLCFRVNELPEEFQYDPVSKTYGDPSRRPEIKSATIEFIAPSEYMLRPPQPAVYLFLLEVSRAAMSSGYLKIVCETLLEELDRLPGDARTQIGFITYDSKLQFYGINESFNQPHMMIVSDLEDVFLPCPDNLLVNLQESRELVRDLLGQLPSKFEDTVETGSALGAALQAAFKLMAATGGRVTVFQVSLPNCGPGALQTRAAGNAKDSSTILNPATDFFKRLALDCSGQQIAVDLFLLNSQFADLATLSGISRFSGGCIQHFPDFTSNNEIHFEALERSFRRYLTRKIGFEAVMRVRCTRGLAIHTFHGNFFVRSTDLLSLPNVNPDAGFGMQLSIEENLSDVQNVCFQAALLYTSSKGERRIRVHTLCLPIAANISDILTGADQQCIVGLLAKMAVDRCQLSSLSDARDAFINVAVDVLSAYRITQNSGPSGGLLAPHNLRLLPLYIVALLKYVAFRSSQSVRVDDRVFAMCQMKSLHLDALLQNVYPDLYPVYFLTDEGAIEIEGRVIPQPPRLHLSAEKLDSRGLFLLDKGEHMILYAGRNISPELCKSVLGVPSFEAISDTMTELPELENPDSQRLRNFVNHLQSEKPFQAPLQIIREDSKHRGNFIQQLLEDRSESALSYYEFLQHLKTHVK